MYQLPIEFEINKTVYSIRNKGDYRTILDCFGALQDDELDTEYRICTALFIFYENFETIEDVFRCADMEKLAAKMFWFFSCGEPDPPVDNGQNHNLIDWTADAQLISSAINAVARTEIRLEPYIHWWTFMGYYMAIGECPLSTVVTIRKKIAEGKKLEKGEREFKRNSPQYFNRDLRTTDQKALDNRIKDLWNSD